MEFISDQFISENVNFKELINELKLAFRDNSIKCPPKLAYNYKSKVSNENNTLLFMPAWDNKKYFGVKLITTTPNNSNTNTSYLNGLYMLFNAENGLPLVTMDAKLITNMRTAATSVLASNFLAKQDASKVLILGNGSLSAFYLQAYASNSALDTIYLWGRNFKKSKKIIDHFELDNPVKIVALDSYSEIVKKVDIISCITSSYNPLIQKEHLSEGQHFDLAGSYTKYMHEISTDVIANCNVYTDNFDITPHHAGELVKAISKGVLNIDSINGDLISLCKNDESKRKNNKENTLFKSTGMAIEDLVIANLIYMKYEKTLNAS
jgi:ornithine cyclodeaminase/alanine dehydrogenase-like protein (mu-crystallin family)